MAEATKIYEWLTEFSIDHNIGFYIEPEPIICMRHIVFYDKEDKSEFVDYNMPEVIFADDDLETFKLYISTPLWDLLGIDLDEEEENAHKT